MTYRYCGSDTTTGPGARRRILDAAIKLYGEHGFDRVTLKDIADRAGVSAPLVIHYFKSSAGLRQACDRDVAEEFRRAKSESVRHEGPMPRNYALEAIQTNRHLLNYLLNAFVAGGDEMDTLFDQLVNDSLVYTGEAEALGLVYPSANPRHRAVVMLLQSFGALLLHKQMKRHLGASPLDDAPDAMLPYISAVMELYTRPVVNGEMYEELMESQSPFDHDCETLPNSISEALGPREGTSP